MSTGYATAFSPLAPFDLTTGQGTATTVPYRLSARTGPKFARPDEQLQAMLSMHSPAVPSSPPAEQPMMLLVTPGLLMTKTEYAVRFGDIALDAYRQRMSPEAFATFVRFAGLVPGSASLDMVRMADPQEATI